MVLFCCCSFHPKLSSWFLSLFVGVVVVVVIHDSPHDISEEIQRSILCPRNTPVNMPDPIRKRFCYGQLWLLRPACSQNRARSCMPDPTSRIRFCSVFPKKGWIIFRKTDPDSIWMVWSGFGQTHLVWKQASVQESLGPVSGRTQPARYQFSTFRLGSVLPPKSWIILCKTSPDPI